MSKAMAIGDLARATGTKVNTIRFYEEVGLMPVPFRTASGRRSYDSRDLRRLAFIRHARALGFSTALVRSLLELSDEPDRECGEVREIAQCYLGEVEERIARLEALRSELSRMVADCASGRRVADCRILEALTGARTPGL